MTKSFISFLKHRAFYAITILLFVTPLIKVHAQPCKEVVGYYPNWQWYDRNKLVSPTSIDYSKYTIINYSFFAPQPDGTIQITDPWADKNLLLGPINWAVAPAGYDVTYDFGNPSYHHPGQKFSDYCHANGVKFLPSIGGWTLSDHFPAIAADPVKRQQFAQSCVQLIQAFGFDGIDLDWEYPGYAAHNGTPQDKANFTLLLQEIRTAIDTYGASVSKTMLLTIAVGASPAHMVNVEWDNISPIVDIINLMSYDFFGTWDPVSNHNAPLFAPQTGNPDFNVSSAVINLLTVHNVPTSKIVVGFAFYGRSFITQGVPGLFVSGPGQADLITFADDLGTPLYYNVLKQQHLFDYHWDNVAKVPYLTGKSGLNTFVSFDDTVSIRHKAEFVVENNLRGGIIWEITGDYLETAPNSGIIAETPLVNTMNDVFCNYIPSGLKEENASFFSNDQNAVLLFPNPVDDVVFVHFSPSLHPHSLRIINHIGQLIYDVSLAGHEETVQISLIDLRVAYGMYFIQVSGDHGMIVRKLAYSPK